MMVDWIGAWRDAMEAVAVIEGRTVNRLGYTSTCPIVHDVCGAQHDLISTAMVNNTEAKHDPCAYPIDEEKQTQNIML